MSSENCRIGMATDVEARISELKNAGTIPQKAIYYVLASGLTYKEANEMEKEFRELCGPHCQGHPGGGFKSGRVWSIYRANWI